MDDQLVFGVSDFVAYLNQTLEIAYPYVTIEGELSNFRVAKNRWVYFDIKDAEATVRCFGTVYILPGPLEDGMTVRISGSPKLHPLYNFNLTVQQIVPVGAGTIKRAADLLAAKLEAEGLFDIERKRMLPSVPRHIGLVTAGTSAAYADFMKIAQARWSGLIIDHFDVLVQGEQAPAQIVTAIKKANELPEPPEVLVLVRGGGSAEDLAAWSSEVVTRAVAGSRVPTLVAIGHEVDISLSELAADKRASTPSNAAELLLPDKKHELALLHDQRLYLNELLQQLVRGRLDYVSQSARNLDERLQGVMRRAVERLQLARQLLVAYNPDAALQRGYALVRLDGMVIKSVKQANIGSTVQTQLSDGTIESSITTIMKTKGSK